MKILSLSTLYPNAEEINRGIFVEQRLRHLQESGKVSLKVIAPVPWFPFKHKVFGVYARFANVPFEENRFGINVLHPRYPVIPKIGMNLEPLLFALFMIPHIKKIIQQGFDFDLIDAHFFYPDGVGAVLLGKLFNKPVIVTARGNDITLYPKYIIPRFLTRWGINNASAVVTVCQFLADEIRKLSVRQNNIHVIRNGVDLSLFKPVNSNTIKDQLGLKGFILISVGSLIERKGHHLVIEAMQELPEMHLLIIGEGPMNNNLKRLAESCNVTDRVLFTGPVKHAELPGYFSMADALVLASSREGLANVLLESIACGTPVVATAVSGNPEIVSSEKVGQLIYKRTASAIADGVRKLVDNYPSRDEIRSFVEHLTWDKTTEKQLYLFSETIDGYKAH
jgi:glycosyltransferase involved in cell wall biosynthesis